jgi:hypothetical protein
MSPRQLSKFLADDEANRRRMVEAAGIPSE